MKILLISSILLIFLSGCTGNNLEIGNEVKNNETSDENSGVTQTKQTITSDSLDLSNQRLDKIPAYVFEQKKLEELNISGNQITGAIQAEIRHLQNLKVLNAGNNNMTGVPAEIGQLQNLEVLDLSNNELTGLPYELGNLKNLKILNIAGNDYSEIDLNIIEEQLPQSAVIVK
ncbi:hypothetical protein C0583_06240 [Candidatus Parcubacteria bacterium]|nr:MAG: hypothetical protein C0583_06240 [Candidatus Parcubacteria bacterium]